MSALTVTVHPDAEAMAEAGADRMAAAILRALARHRVAHVCLTGGRGGGAVLRALSRDSGIEWGRIHCWWSDERFLPEGDEARNDTLARRALLENVDVPAANLHPMPARDGDARQAALRYAAELAEFGRPGPPFCVSVLGMGEDGHVASLFPEHRAVASHEPVVAVLDSPKPPPERITMTLPLINTAAEVLIIATGSQKADAVGLLINAPGPLQLPAAGVRGAVETRLLLDEAAAVRVPAAFRARL